MKQQIRKTLVLGAGALCLAGGTAAHADTEVEIHGIIDVYAGAENPIGEDDWAGKLSSGGKDTSYWGLSLRHQVNDGLAVVGALEAFLRPDRGDSGRFGGDVFFARNANVGVETGFGTVRGGRVTAPLFLPMVFTNPFGGSFEFSPANYHTYAGAGNAPLVGDSGWSDTVQYTSPNLNGVTVNVLYGFGENEGDDSRGDDRIGANAVYRAGDFTGTVAAHAVDYGLDVIGFDDEGGTQYAALAGGMYNFGAFQLYGQYQHIDNDLDADDFSINSVTVGASVDAGPGQVLASYAYADASRFGTGDYDDGGERHTWAVGYELPLSDMATAYATYFMDDIDDASDDGHNVGIGVQLRF